MKIMTKGLIFANTYSAKHTIAKWEEFSEDDFWNLLSKKTKMALITGAYPIFFKVSSTNLQELSRIVSTIPDKVYIEYIGDAVISNETICHFRIQYLGNEDMMEIALATIHYTE